MQRKFLSLSLLALGAAVYAFMNVSWAVGSQEASFLSHGVINTALDIFFSEINSVSAGITQAATRLFWILCSIAIVLNGIKLIFQDGDLQAFAAVLVRFMLIVGLFYFLLLNGGDIGRSLVNSLMSLTAHSGSGSPQNLADRIIDISVLLIEKVDPGESGLSIDRLIMGFFLVFFDFMMFGVVASVMVLYFAAYILCVLGVFVLGFGALSLTRPLAVNYLRSMLGISLELMAMILVCNIGIRGLERVEEYLSGGGQISFGIYGMLIFVACFMWSCSSAIPALVGSLASGFTVSGSLGNVMGGFASRFLLPLTMCYKLYNELSKDRSPKRPRWD